MELCDEIEPEVLELLEFSGTIPIKIIVSRD
jgi:hypothetical protein